MQLKEGVQLIVVISYYKQFKTEHLFVKKLFNWYFINDLENKKVVDTTKQLFYSFKTIRALQ
jgi:hypothetical protein